MVWSCEVYGIFKSEVKTSRVYPLKATITMSGWTIFGYVDLAYRAWPLSHWTGIPFEFSPK